MRRSRLLLVRQLKVDSARFVGGQGSLPIRFTVTSPARVRARAVSGAASLLVDSAVVTGTVNVRWPARLPNGDPVPAGDWLIVVDATAGQNSFSASQPVRIVHGTVDTLPHLTSLPGYQELPETEIAPQRWRRSPSGSRSDPSSCSRATARSRRGCVIRARASAAPCQRGIAGSAPRRRCHE